jgi:hypothetical protein
MAPKSALRMTVQWRLRIVVESAFSVTSLSLLVRQNVVFVFFGLRLTDTAEVGAAWRRRFHSKIRAELVASVEKSGG